MHSLSLSLSLLVCVCACVCVCVRVLARDYMYIVLFVDAQFDVHEESTLTTDTVFTVDSDRLSRQKRSS